MHIISFNFFENLTKMDNNTEEDDVIIVKEQQQQQEDIKISNTSTTIPSLFRPTTPSIPPPPSISPPILTSTDDQISTTLTIVSSENSTHYSCQCLVTWFAKPWTQNNNNNNSISNTSDNNSTTTTTSSNTHYFWCDANLGELEVHQTQQQTTSIWIENNAPRVNVAPFDPIMALHVLGIPACCIDIILDDQQQQQQSNPNSQLEYQLWKNLNDECQIIRATFIKQNTGISTNVSSTTTHDIWIAPLHPNHIKSISRSTTPTQLQHHINSYIPSFNHYRFIAYAVPKLTSFNLLITHRLALVIGIENTLLRHYDLQENPPPREAELAMLQEFHQSNKISLPGGRIVQAEMEPISSSTTNTNEQHPVLTLTSIQGTVVFTKVEGKSYIVHIRPGWPSFRSYICGLPKSRMENTSPSTNAEVVPNKPFFKLYPVAKEAKGALALELWRILDPEQVLISKEQISTTAGLFPAPYVMDIIHALGNNAGNLKMTVCVDNSARWSGADLVWPLRAYDPYRSPLDSGLAVALQVIHDLRNEFFYGCDAKMKDVMRWASSLSFHCQQSSLLPPIIVPIISNTSTLLTTLKHRWLQEFQSAYGRSVPEELASARDFIDPVIRNKHHLIVDTNVFLSTASENFALFETLKHAHEKKIVIIVPYATVQELDWQKHSAKTEGKSDRAQLCIRYINSFAASNSKWLMIQSQDEDGALMNKRKMSSSSNNNSSSSSNSSGGDDSFNTKNDARILDCARLRQDAGIKTILISGDVNLRNLASANGVPSVRAGSLWTLVCDPKMQRLPPEHWVPAIAEIEKAKAMNSNERIVNPNNNNNNTGSNNDGMKRIKMT
jgi:rRNA-processing protein FCF1